MLNLRKVDRKDYIKIVRKDEKTSKEDNSLSYAWMNSFDDKGEKIAQAVYGRGKARYFVHKKYIK